MQAIRTRKRSTLLSRRFRRASVEQYLENELRSERKNEYINGEIRPMPYTSENHGLLVANLIGLFFNALKGTACRVYPSDRMLHVPECNQFFYPDVMVVCGQSEFFQYKQKMHATLNPTVLIEMLSESPSEYDEVGKWQCYKKIPTLQQYVRVSQNQKLVELYTRVGTSNDWLNTDADQPDQIVMIGGCEIRVADVYEHIDV